MNEVIFALGIMAGFLLLSQLLRGLFEAKRSDIEKRLSPDGESSSSSIILDTSRPSWNNEMDQFFDRIVVRTGLDMTSGQGLLLIMLAGGASAALFYYFGRDIPIVGLAFAGGAGLMFGLLLLLQNQWQRQLDSQFPDVFFFLARSVRTGMSFEQSVAMVGDHAAAPIAGEMRRLAHQFTLGVSPRSALRSLANRTGSSDANALLTAVTLHREVGGNLAMLLDQLASASRERLRLQKQLDANTAMARTSAIFIGAAYPLILLYYYLARPEFSDGLFTTTGGWLIILVSLLLEIIGAYWIYWLIRSSQS